MVRQWLVVMVVAGLVCPVVQAEAVPLDISDDFNTDAWAGPLEVQECYIDGSHDHKELFGDLQDGNGFWILSQGWMMICNSTSGGFGEPYSISGQWFHPLYISGTEGTPEDGVISGDDRDYHVASPLGNDTLSGDWTEVADPSTYDVEPNCIVVGSLHNTADWQVSSVTVELPSAQKAKYADVNFILTAMNMADKARNMKISALYGSSGGDVEELYAFSTADGGSGPLMTDSSGGNDFIAAYTMSKYYSATSGATGAVVSGASRLWEFSEPLELDSSKTLWGFKIEDVNPSLNWNARGVCVFAVSATPAVVELDLSDGFNMDAFCGPKEFQECRDDGAHDLVDLYGDLADGNGNFILQQGNFMIGNSTGSEFAYSVSGDPGHPVNYSGTQGVPEDGALTGGDGRAYLMACVGGNAMLDDDWTEVVDPSTYENQPNCLVVGSSHSTATWQVASLTVELPPNQKDQYDNVNLVLAAMNVADKARNMQILALYGETGADEEVLYSFTTADGGDGPLMTDSDGGDDFDVVYTMSKAYSASSGATGNVLDKTSRLWEFSEPLDLNSSKILWGFKLKDVNPSLNWNARGLAVFAATAVVSTGANLLPVADAGDDQLVDDTDNNGYELVTLDGSGSSDADGTIASYVWKEGETQIATGVTPQVSLSTGTHTITLTVVDNDSGSDTDTVVVEVNPAPVADAGDDQTVYDDDETGSETVTLDGGGSSDDGTIASYVWKEGETQLATGETASVSLAVGQHTITLIVTDDDSCTDSDTMVVTVSDNHPPVAHAGDDQYVSDSDDNGSQVVTLDGSGSSDQDGSISSYVWKNSAGTQIGTGQTAQVTLSCGINDITLIVTDNDSATDSAVVRVWVVPKGDYFVDGTNGSDSNDGSENSPWKTIDHAADNVSAGDVIIVKEGIYRENVGPAVSGTAANPIWLLGNPGDRVIISGADELTGWTQCTSQIAKGNPNYQNIYYVDIAWAPTRVVQDEIDLEVARTEGWYVCDGGTTSTLVDSENLTQADDYWNGATVFMWDVSITAQYEKKVADFDASTDTITIDGVWNSTVTPEADTDRYYLANKVELINSQGEWAVEDIGGGSYRVFCWADGDGDPDGYTMEGSRRDRFIFEYGAQSYWILDNFELRHSQSHGVGSWASCQGHITVRNCSIHHNDATGIYGRYNDYGTYKNNFVCWNDYGIANCGASNVTIENNEVAWNLVDGVLTTGPGGESWAEYVTLRGNYIHDHFMWGHPDNCQSYANIRYLSVEDNLLINSVQSYMMEGTEDSTFDNNVIIGAAAYMIIFGWTNVADMTVENNTLCFAGYGIVNHSGDDGYHYKNNILVMGHDNKMWGGITDTTDYSSDYNCWWHGPDISGYVITYNSTSYTLSGYATASGEDTHSYYADPKFVNAPSYFSLLDSTKQDDFTSTRVYLPSSTIDLFEVGDKIEIDWDSTVRTITTVNTESNYIEFTPGDARIAQKANQVANWLNNTDFTLDFSLRAGSPAIGSDDVGGDMGSDINVQNYCNGDFNGDGRRDIPVWPVE